MGGSAPTKNTKNFSVPGPEFEKMWYDQESSCKILFSISDEEQERRFQDRITTLLSAGK
jgi:polyphosphate kinase 2 (PPK2 family)